MNKRNKDDRLSRMRLLRAATTPLPSKPRTHLGHGRLITISLGLFIAFTTPANARETCEQILFQRKHVSGLSLQICQARIIKNPNCTEGQIMAEACPGHSLAVDLRIANQSEVKKLEFEGPLRFFLKDNFRNTYTRIDQPDPSAWPRSLYPGTGVVRELIFEPPVESYESLTLVVDTAPLGIDPAVLTLPIYKEMVHYPNHNLPSFSPYMTVIDILKPKRTTKVLPGDVVKVAIQINERVSRPDTVLIITPNFTLEDIQHRYHYNVRIPKEWEPGRPFQIAVVARWDKWEDQRIASESVSLTVLDPKTACQDECLNNRGRVVRR